MQEYQVVKAKTPIEALAQSDWSVDDMARCIDVQAVGNSDGTFTLFASFEHVTTKSGHTRYITPAPYSCLNRP